MDSEIFSSDCKLDRIYLKMEDTRTEKLSDNSEIPEAMVLGGAILGKKSLKKLVVLHSHFSPFIYPLYTVYFTIMTNPFKLRFSIFELLIFDFTLLRLEDSIHSQNVLHLFIHRSNGYLGIRNGSRINRNVGHARQPDT